MLQQESPKLVRTHEFNYGDTMRQIYFYEVKGNATVADAIIVKSSIEQQFPRYIIERYDSIGNLDVVVDSLYVELFDTHRSRIVDTVVALPVNSIIY